VQMPHYCLLSHVSFYLTVNSNLVPKSDLTAVGIFISSHFILQVKAFLLTVIQLSRLLTGEMTV